MKVLVVAAHPDDEVLGCGGTLARWARAGHEIAVMILAEGATSRDEDRDPHGRASELSALAEAADKAAAILGVSNLELYRMPDNRLDSVPLLDVVKTIEDKLLRFGPDTVLTHHAGDLNIDHQQICQAVVTACRPVPESTVKKIMTFEVPSSTEWQTDCHGAAFMPNSFIDISETLAIKVEALSAYTSEMRPWPHPRSIEAVEYLARWRGATVGAPAAEAFRILREIS